MEEHFNYLVRLKKAGSKEPPDVTLADTWPTSLISRGGCSIAVKASSAQEAIDKAKLIRDFYLTISGFPP